MGESDEHEGARKSVLSGEEEVRIEHSVFYRNLRDMTYAAKLLTAMSAEVSNKKTITDILEGKNTRGLNTVVQMVRAFRESGMSDICDYYHTYPKDCADKILSEGIQ